MSWTIEREEKLRELWKKGQTASQIASMLGNTTRNAVIGKAHRLNLEARAVSKKSTHKINTEKLGYILLEIGGGRKTTMDKIDPTCGFNIYKKI